MKHFSIQPAVFILILLLFPRVIWASPSDLYGYGAKARAMGGAFTGVADDFSALYYNVAGLGQIHENRVTVGYMSADPRTGLEITPWKETTARQRNQLHHLEVDQTELKKVNGYEMGIILAPHERVTAGISAHIPVGHSVILQPIDPHVPTFIMYDHYAERAASYSGIAVSVLPNLFLGAGTHVFVKVDGQLDVPLELTDENLSLGGNGSEVEPIDTETHLTIKFPWTVEPFAGVLYKPLPWLRFGGSYRSHFQWDVKVGATLDVFMKDITIDLAKLRKMFPELNNVKTVIQVSIPALGNTPVKVPVDLSQLSGTVVASVRLPVEAMLTMADFYLPQQLTFGTAVEPTDQWTIALDGTWCDWSQMPSPDMQLDITKLSVSVATLPANLKARVQGLSVPVLGTVGSATDVMLTIPGIDADLSIPVKIKTPTRPQTHDVIKTRIGTEYRFMPVRVGRFAEDVRFAVRGGYAYEPSPFDTDAGYVNLIDPDRHLVSTGAGVKINQRFSLDTYLQYYYLVPMSYDKSGYDKTFPASRVQADGSIWATGVQGTVAW